jgi:hypothetical protein
MPGTEERHSFRWRSSAASHSRLLGSASLRSGIDLTRLFDANVRAESNDDREERM